MSHWAACPVEVLGNYVSYLAWEHPWISPEELEEVAEERETVSLLTGPGGMKEDGWTNGYWTWIFIFPLKNIVSEQMHVVSNLFLCNTLVQNGLCLWVN